MNMDVSEFCIIYFFSIFLFHEFTIGEDIEGNTTICIGDTAKISFNTDDAHKIFVAIFLNKDQTAIGEYDPDKAFYIRPKFESRYLIEKVRDGIELRIKDTRRDDHGKYVCIIEYENGKKVKMEKYLILKEKENSSAVSFETVQRGQCLDITCSANSTMVELKKPDGEILEGKGIHFNTCQDVLINGEYSCCLISNCSESACQNKTIPGTNIEESGKTLIIGVPISIAIVVFWILIAIIYCCWRRTKKIKKASKTDENKENPNHGSKRSNDSAVELQSTTYYSDYSLDEDKTGN